MSISIRFTGKERFNNELYQKIRKTNRKRTGKIVEDKEAKLYIFHKKTGTIPISLFGLLKDIPTVEFKQADSRDDVLITVGMILGTSDKDEVFNADSDIKLPDYVKTSSARKPRTKNTKPDEKKKSKCRKLCSPK